MSQEKPDILDFLRINRRIVDISTQEELLYRIKAKTGLEIEAITTIVNLLFEEMINLMLLKKKIKMRIGQLWINSHHKFTFKPTIALKQNG